MENQTTTYQPISIKDWMIILLIMCIPIVNFVMLFVWGFSDATHPSKANWAKASLIWIAIIAALYFFFFAAIIGAAISLS